jgi:hypothetical protein
VCGEVVRLSVLRHLLALFYSYGESGSEFLHGLLYCQRRVLAILASQQTGSGVVVPDFVFQLVSNSCAMIPAVIVDAVAVPLIMFSKH